MRSKREPVLLRLDTELLERARQRASERGLTLSEYLRNVIVADLAETPVSDPLATLTAESATVSAIFLRRILDGVIDHDEAVRFEATAIARAREMIERGERL